MKRTIKYSPSVRPSFCLFFCLSICPSFRTTGPIPATSNTMETSCPIDVQRHGHWLVVVFWVFFLSSRILVDTPQLLDQFAPSHVVWNCLDPVDVQRHGHCPVGPIREFPSGIQIPAEAVTPLPLDQFALTFY